MTDETKLLPCPFCGGEAQSALVQAGGMEWAQVECLGEGCGMIGPARGTEAEAIAAWNTRTDPTRQPDPGEARELVERLRARVRIETACGNRTENATNHVRLMDEAADFIERAFGSRGQGEVLEAIAANLIDQSGEPWPMGTEGARLHYWRDKAIHAAAAIRAALQPTPEM